MALNSYLKIKGQQQGQIKGGVIQKGREGFIQVHAWSHNLKVPLDAASGLATGRRQHGVLRVTKPTEVSTAPLYLALINNESLQVELMCWEPNKLGTAGGQGVETLFFTIELTNARLVEIQAEMPDNRTEPTSKLAQYEELSFAYETIIWTYKLGNKIASDSWGTPIP